MLLSRLLITGSISCNTPKCVLLEIADAHGIDYSSILNSTKLQHLLIDKINKTLCPTIDSELSDISQITERITLQNMARFVNKDVKWKSTTLKVAFKHLYQYTVDDHITLDAIIFGLQTNESPKRDNLCVLYKICNLFHINVNYYTTAQQMVDAVKLLNCDAGKILTHVTNFLNTDATKSQLISILLMNPSTIANTISQEINQTIVVDDGVNFQPANIAYHDLLQNLYPSLTSINQLRARVTPTTNVGAIGLAAVLFHIDLSQAQNPLDEFLIVKLDPDNYIPKDRYMAYWQKINPTLFDLTKTFNPTFPVDYYHDYHLSDLAKNHGYNGLDTKTHHYEYLQLQYTTDTFYYGRLPILVTEELVIDLEDISMVPKSQLYTFGSKIGALYPISLSELYHMFSTNKNFISPFTANTIFTDDAITKLISILRNQCDIDTETIELQNKVLDLIYYIQSINFPDDETRAFVAAYNNAHPSAKDDIVKLLVAILHCGMYMRGWPGIGHAYTVGAKIVSEDEQILVDAQIMKALNNIECLARGLGKLGSRILNLPLVRYVDGKYLKSVHSDDGFTIIERLNLIKEGESTNNMGSCIRLSSNWICASAHKYIIALGQPPPFDINALRKIS